METFFATQVKVAPFVPPGVTAAVQVPPSGDVHERLIEGDEDVCAYPSYAGSTARKTAHLKTTEKTGFIFLSISVHENLPITGATAANHLLALERREISYIEHQFIPDRLRLIKSRRFWDVM